MYEFVKLAFSERNHRFGLLLILEQLYQGNPFGYLFFKGIFTSINLGVIFYS